MSTAPESQAPPPPPTFPRRTRTLLYVGVGLLGLLIIVGLALFYYVRSGRLNRYIISQVQDAVKEYGLRAEIGGLDIVWSSQTAKVHDVRIYNATTNQLVASAKTVILTAEVQHPFALSLNREVVFKQLNMDGLDLYYTNDPKGRSNLEGLHTPPPSAPSRITFDYSQMTGEVSNGTIHLDDRQAGIQAVLQNLTAGVAPAPDRQSVNVTVKSTGGNLTYQGRSTSFESLDLNTRAGDFGADLNTFAFKSKPINLTAGGKIVNWHIPTYTLNVQSQSSLAELTRVFLPDEELKGDASFDGQVKGTAAQYQVTGKLTSNDLTAPEARVRGLHIDDLLVKPENNKIGFSSKSIRAASAEAQGTRLTNLVVSGPRGDYDNGRINLTAGQATVARVDLIEGRANEIALRGIKAEINNDRYQLRGDLTVRSASLQGFQVEQVKGQLAADNKEVALSNFNAAIFGGSASGNLTAQLARNSNVHVAANFNNLATHEIFKLVASGEAPLAGTVSGTADITFPSGNPKRLTGALNAQLSAQTTQTTNAIPVNGTIALKATNGLFNIDQLNLHTAASTVTASGPLSLDGNSNLAFSVTSTNAEELSTIFDSLNVTPSIVADLKPTLSGNFSATGTITGQLSNPTISSDVKASNVALSDGAVGSLSLHVLYSPTNVKIDNGLLTQTTGGKVNFSLDIPTGASATTGKLDATFQQLDFDALLATIGLSVQQNALTGLLNGEAHLTNLPASPQGAVNLTMVNGTIAGQKVQSATAKITFNGETAKLETIDLQLPQGRLIADGTYAFNTEDFQIQGRAENVDLAAVVSAINPNAPAVSGTATGTFKASGNAEDLSKLTLDLDAHGQNVAIAGRQAGPLQVTAHSTPDGKINLNVVTGVIGVPQTITGTLDLRAPGNPITISTDLKSLDLKATLAILAPDWANVVAGNITGTLRLNGPIYNDEGNLTLDKLQGSLALSDATVSVSGTPITVSTPVTVRLNGPQLTVDQIHLSGQGVNLLVGGTIAIESGVPMNFTLSGVADLAVLTASVPGISAEGKLDIEAHMEGTLGDPKLSGSVTLRDGILESTDVPIDILNATATVTLAGDKITLQNFTAKANDGTLTGSGVITLSELIKPKDWNFTLQAKAVDFYYQGASLVAEGNLTLTGTPQGQTLSGKINIPEGEYLHNFDLTALATSGGGGTGFDLGISGPTGGSSSVFGVPLGLDVNVTAPNTLLVRNSTVNTVANASVHIGGNLGNTDLSGQISLEGGTVRFRGHRYNITTGTLSMTGGAGSVPELNLAAESTISGYQVFVGIHGPLNDLGDLQLSADPQLTRAEVLSLIATGRLDTASVNSDQMVQSSVTTAASLLSSQVLFNPLGEQAQQLFGFTQFQIDPVIRPSTNPAARLTIGRQLARGVSFLYSTNLASEQDQLFSLEYDLSNRLSVVTGYSQGGLDAVQSTDNVFTFDLRGRKRFALGGNFPPAPGIRPNFAKTVRPPVIVGVEAEDVQISTKSQKKLLPIKTEGYSRALMRLGEVNLKNYLQQKGYFFAEVTSRCEPANCEGPNLRVIYDVRPQKRYDLDKVEIEGASMLNLRELKGKLETQPSSFVGGIPLLSSLPLLGGLARGITSTDKLRNDRETIRTAMADAGYRSAHVTSRIGVSTESDNLIVTFTVEPGPLSTIGDVVLEGSKSVGTGEVLGQLNLAKGKPFNITAARQGAQKIDTFYAGKGYLDVTTDLNIEDLPDNRVRLRYKIAEGEKAIVREIDIRGQVMTRESSIRQFLAFNTGDVLTPEAMRQSQRDLYATGAFREVTISPEKIGGSNGADRRVVVKLTEAKPLLLTYGLGYSTDAGPRGLIELKNSNLFGRANSGILRTAISAREQLAQVIFNDPRPWGTKWPLTLSVFYDRNTQVRSFVPEVIVNGVVQPGSSGPAYGVNRFAGYALIQHKTSKFSSIRFRYSFQNVKLFNIENIPILEIARNEQTIRVGTLSAGFTRDTRDSFVDPEKGRLFTADYTFAASFLGGNENYNQLFTSFQTYHKFTEKVPVLHDSVFAFAARVGIAAPYKIFDRNGDGIISEPEKELPISERFFAGGVTTLRGFRFDEAGPQGILEPTTPNTLPVLVPIGGDALTIFNFELRVPIGGPFRLVPFYDLGNVFSRPKDISFGGMTNTIGLGFRIKTPIGPIGVDFGHLLDPPVFFSAQGFELRQPTNVFHLRFGQTF